MPPQCDIGVEVGMFEEYSHTFRAYDIRGVFNEDLLPEMATCIGMAVATYAPGDYAVGGDTRGPTLAIKHALIAGLLAAGANVYDIGTVPIGAAIYSTVHLGKGMAYVTASHLPPEWDGIKLSAPRGRLLVGGDIYAIRDLVLSGKVKRVPYDAVGGYMVWDILPEYASFLRKNASSSGLKIVVDCANGASALVAPRLLRDLGHSVVVINGDIDPRFPARGSEPMPDKLGELVERVKREGADLGVAFDGDGDRTVFVAGDGRILSAEQAAIVMLEGMGWGDVVANVECSMILEDYVKSYGGRVYRVPVGRTYMIEEVKRRGAALGVESSGHYVVKGGLNYDDGLLTMLHFVDAVAKLDRPIESIVPPVPPRKKIRVPVDDRVKFAVMERLKEDLMSRYDSVTTIDGVRVDLEDGWFLIRPSNTEPLIRITVEARNSEKLEKLVETAQNALQRALG